MSDSDNYNENIDSYKLDKKKNKEKKKNCCLKK